MLNEEATKKKIFHKVKRHLLEQKSKSKRYYKYMDGTKKPMCAYRGYGGKKCAVGALIKDKCYYKGLEGSTMWSVIVQEALEQSGIPTTSTIINMLRQLQIIHDSEPPRKWPALLDELYKQLFPKKP